MVQIFGRKKCFDTRAAERFFKERKIKYQYIDIDEKGLSKRELQSVVDAVGDVNCLINEKSAAYEELYVRHIKRTSQDLCELLIENPNLYLTPIVRNGRLATAGTNEQAWKDWIKNENV